MNRLMLLAQLCGEGKSTENLLTSHGFHDLESVAHADSRELAEALGMSAAAAVRMIRQAEELLKDAGLPREEAEKAGPSPSESGPNVLPMEAPDSRARGGRGRAVDVGVTGLEVASLRRTAPRGPVFTPDAVSPAAVGTGAPAEIEKRTPRVAEEEASFWRFG